MYYKSAYTKIDSLYFNRISLGNNDLVNKLARLKCKETGTGLEDLSKKVIPQDSE